MEKGEQIMNTFKKEQPLMYRVNEACRQLGISRATIYRLVNSGSLTLKKISTRTSGITTESINRHLGKASNDA